MSFCSIYSTSPAGVSTLTMPSVASMTKVWSLLGDISMPPDTFPWKATRVLVSVFHSKTPVASTHSMNALHSHQ